MNFIYRLSFWVFVVCLADKIDAQSYNFTLSQSQQVYAALTNGSKVPSGQDWTFRKIWIPIGFHYSYQGHSYDSLMLLPEGEVSFDGSTKTDIVILKNLRYKADVNGKFSNINTQTSGSSGQRIFKLEYAEAGLTIDPSEYVNAQLWLYEQNGAIEFHYGPNSYASAKDSANMAIIGPVNWLMNTSKNGFTLSGNPQKTVTGKQMTTMSDLRFLVRIPDNGIVFTLTPSN